ncbi:MAG: hypothetical protein NUW09_05990 [Deltaproteobacteria bacterium]|nr:hypothetical protein [Deltaproteobacteria bacterium]
MGAGNYSMIKTVITGETITASDRNAEHQNHITNHNFPGLDDYSTNAAQMQSTADPYPAGSESLATSGSGELERIRYLLKQQHGCAQWYIFPDLVSKTADYTATANDRVILCDATSAAVTVTLPTAVGNTDKVFFIKKTDASGNSVTVDGNGAETIDGAATVVLSERYDFLVVASDNVGWQIIGGQMANFTRNNATQTLANKTLTTPTVASFVNANHNHADAAGGGGIDTAAITALLGTRNDAAANGTVYQAATDIIVGVTLVANNTSRSHSTGYTGTTSSPASARAICYVHYASADGRYNVAQSYSFVVKKNEYWKVVKTEDVGTATQSIFVVPIGS